MERAHGIDVSKWQGYFSPAENPPRPIDFAIQRVSVSNLRDSMYDSIRAGVLQVPIRGSYHYLTADSPWKVQMDVFLAASKPDYHFLALDVEKKNNNILLTDKPKPGFVETVVPSLEYIASRDARPLLLYLNPDTWATWMRPYWGLLKKYDIWIARYWNARDPNGDPKAPMEQGWRFWQYDDKGMKDNGKQFGAGSYGLDLDVFNGTVEDLQAWAKPTTPSVCICPICGNQHKKE